DVHVDIQMLQKIGIRGHGASQIRARTEVTPGPREDEAANGWIPGGVVHRRRERLHQRLRQGVASLRSAESDDDRACNLLDRKLTAHVLPFAMMTRGGGTDELEDVDGAVEREPGADADTDPTIGVGATTVIAPSMGRLKGVAMASRGRDK